ESSPRAVLPVFPHCLPLTAAGRPLARSGSAWPGIRHVSERFAPAVSSVVALPILRNHAFRLPPARTRIDVDLSSQRPPAHRVAAEDGTISDKGSNHLAS